MVKDIITDENQLRERNRTVDTKREFNNYKNIILDLKDTLRANENAVGLAAPQIGYNVRIFVINFNGDLKTFINPIINKSSGAYFATEKCMSIPDKEYLVLRFNTIEFFYQTPLGKNEAARLTGYGAQIFQHELDHLDGILISDKGVTEVTEEFKNLNEEERKEFFKGILDSIDELKDNLKKSSKEELIEEKKQIESNPHSNEALKEDAIKDIDTLIEDLDKQPDNKEKSNNDGDNDE